MSTGRRDGFEVIYQYSRRQALEDGVLIDAGTLSAEVGFTMHVALTSAAWARCVKVPVNMRPEGQSEAGRLSDVLWSLRMAIHEMKADDPQVLFKQGVRNRPGVSEIVELKAVCGPGDSLEPVVTVMLPDED